MNITEFSYSANTGRFPAGSSFVLFNVEQVTGCFYKNYFLEAKFNIKVRKIKELLRNFSEVISNQNYFANVQNFINQ